MEPIKEDYRGQHFMLTGAGGDDLGYYWVNAAIFFKDRSQFNVKSDRHPSMDIALEEARARAKAEIDTVLAASNC